MMSYLSEKKELDSEMRTQELKYKREALEAETKMRQEQLEVERRRIALQEQQMNIFEWTFKETAGSINSFR